MTFLTLDYKGVIVAAILAVVFLILGSFHLIFVLFMIYFLVLSAIVTAIGKNYKKKIGVYEKSRGVSNVVYNAGGPLIMAVGFALSQYTSHFVLAQLFLIGFAASVAAITADKFSSEIGVLDGIPKVIFNMKNAKKGASGAVTIIGLGAGFFAAVLVSLPFVVLALHATGANTLYVFTYAPTIISITLGGFAGTVVDSMFGYFEEKGIGTKYTSNLLCGIIGGLLGMAFLLIF
jgi:uncharacterized protein (TIGR00297 family)